MGASREIARTAVRERLADVAVEAFAQHGFDRLTISDIAERAGVSKSTFLRHFRTKEDAVLCVLDRQGSDLATVLRDRPAAESAWVALRRCLDVLLDEHLQDTAAALRLTKLSKSTPGLCSGRLEKHSEWADLLARTLVQREDESELSPLGARSLCGAAMACLASAVDAWEESDGEHDLRVLLDEAFLAVHSRT